MNGACCDERVFRERRVLRRARFPMSASHAPIADLVLLPCPYGNDPSTPTAYSRLSIQEPMARPDSARGLAVPERLPSAPHGLVVLPHGLVVLRRGASGSRCGRSVVTAFRVGRGPHGVGGVHEGEDGHVPRRGVGVADEVSRVWCQRAAWRGQQSSSASWVSAR